MLLMLIIDILQAFGRRLKALQEHAVEPLQWSERSYTLSPLAQQVLINKGYSLHNYSFVYGVPLQCATHAECIAILEEIPRYNNKHCHSTAHALADFVEAGRLYNQAGQISKAYAFLDVCWTVLDCCAAITEGVAHGVVSLANPIIHPIETMENFKRLVEIAGCCVGKVTKLLWSSFITHDVETATRITQEFDAIYNALVTYVKEHPREAIKQGTSFITQTILMNYGTHALHSFFKQAMVELPEYINLLPETAAAVEVQAATLTAAIATHGARVAVNTTKMGEDFLALSKIISGMGPYIPLGQHLPHLEKIYKDSVKGFADKPNVYVEFRDGVLHVFEPGIKLTKTKAKVDGFHHDYLTA
jgi:hypothetical protein